VAGVDQVDVAPLPARSPSRRPTRLLALAALVVLVGFWTWALFFASKESANRIGDRAWAARAADICEREDERREALIDLRPVEGDPAMLAERAAIVDRATDVLTTMLDDVVAVPPEDEKGRAIVPLWEADYRTYLADRRAYADVLRAGENEPFSETAVDGIPISDKIGQFAGDNEMAACAPPTDLS
jgi:hypothetical protein